MESRSRIFGNRAASDHVDASSLSVGQLLLFKSRAGAAGKAKKAKTHAAIEPNKVPGIQNWKL